MLGLGNTLSLLAAQKRQWQRFTVPSGAGFQPPGGKSRLTEIDGFGTNPGRLRMLLHVPANPAPRPALVVVLHGCTQDAAGYDHGAGWSDLAERHGFVVLYAEQSRRNNPNTCFNWFNPAHSRRAQGEPASIAQMIGHAVRDHGIDEGRIFVTGLSAGGAMAGVMLAAYPELFAAGAIIAGLPYSTAGTVQEAFSSMAEGRRRTASEWGDLVRAAGGRQSAPWPRVSIWHGSADKTVNPVNAEELVAQWTNVHGVPQAAAVESRLDGATRRVWMAAGGAAVEAVLVPGMGHGTPLATSGPRAIGNPGPYLLDVGISSTWHIASDWGLLAEQPAALEAKAAEAKVDQAARPTAGASQSRNGASGAPRPRPKLANQVQDVIAKALRSAGLMR